MNRQEIKNLVKEAFIDKIYGKYPYSHQSGDEDEPKADYEEEWKRFCLHLVRDESRQKAIELAKVLVKDLELFEDVLDAAGQNQSLGSEILRKLDRSPKIDDLV